MSKTEKDWNYVKCHECGDEIIEDDAEFDPENGDPYCDSCFFEKYEECPICKGFHERPKKPEDTRFLINSNTAADANVEIGLYQVLEFPFYRDDFLFGFDGFYDGTIKLVRECKPGEVFNYIDKYFNKRTTNIDEIEGTGFICPSCWNMNTKGEQNHE